jgi:hypothetical protein
MVCILLGRGGGASAQASPPRAQVLKQALIGADKAAGCPVGTALASVSRNALRGNRRSVRCVSVLCLSSLPLMASAAIVGASRGCVQNGRARREGARPRSWGHVSVAALLLVGGAACSTGSCGASECGVQLWPVPLPAAPCAQAGRETEPLCSGPHKRRHWIECRVCCNSSVNRAAAACRCQATWPDISRLDMRGMLRPSQPRLLRTPA